MNKMNKMITGIKAIADLFNYVTEQTYFSDNYDSLYDYEDSFHYTNDDLLVANTQLRIYNHAKELLSDGDINQSWCGRPAALYKTRSGLIDKFTERNNIDFEWLTEGKPDSVLPEGRTFIFLLFEEDEIRLVSVNPYKGKIKEGVIPYLPFKERDRLLLEEYVF